MERPQSGDKLMFWPKVGVFAIDGLAILAGLAISAPFFLILITPVLIGF
jgi:hypothetical protein